VSKIEKLDDHEASIVANALYAFEMTKNDVLEEADIEHVFAAYSYFSENVVGIALERVGDFLLKLVDGVPIDGSVAAAGLSVTVYDRAKDAVSLTLRFGEQSYSFREAAGGRVPGGSATLREVVVAAPVRHEDGGSEDRKIASATLLGGRRFSGRGNCLVERFSDFTAFCDLMRGPMVDYLVAIPSVSSNDGSGDFNVEMMTKAAQLPMIDADGGLPGKLTNHAVKRMCSHGATTLAKYMASELPDIVSAASARGAVWGEAALSYHDGGHLFMAIPAEGDRVALYHRANGLDVNNIVYWGDGLMEGKATELNVAAVSDSDLASLVETISAGGVPSGSPTMRRDAQARKIAYSEFLEAGALQASAQVLAYDGMALKGCGVGRVKEDREFARRLVGRGGVFSPA
jgi:hypothetical protein